MARSSRPGIAQDLGKIISSLEKISLPEDKKFFEDEILYYMKNFQTELNNKRASFTPTILAMRSEGIKKWIRDVRYFETWPRYSNSEQKLEDIAVRLEALVSQVLSLEE